MLPEGSPGLRTHMHHQLAIAGFPDATRGPKLLLWAAVMAGFFGGSLLVISFVPAELGADAAFTITARVVTVVIGLVLCAACLGLSQLRRYGGILFLAGTA